MSDESPFTRPGSGANARVGVVLCHGFTGTPASMRPWGDFLSEQGYAVSVPLLPGHCAPWQELAAARWEQWYGELLRAYDQLAATVDVMIATGLSMGGGLVLKLAADRPEQIAGIVPVNPAVKLSRPDLKLVPIAKHVVPYFPKIAGDIKKPGVSESGTDRTPLKAVDQMLRGTRLVREALPQVTQPVLLITSLEDHVVDPASRTYILDHIGTSELSELRLENSYHVATLDYDQQLIFDRSLEFIRKVTE